MDETSLKRYYGESENVIYSGSPMKKPYPIIEIIVLFTVFIGVALTDGFLMGASVFKTVAGDNLGGEIALYAVAFVLHFVPLCGWGINVIKKFFMAKNVCYLVTAARVSVICGTTVTEVKTLFFNKETEVSCKKDDLVFAVGEENLTLKHVENCSSVCEKINSIIKNIEL